MFAACCASLCCKAHLSEAQRSDHDDGPPRVPPASAAVCLLGPNGTFVDLSTRQSDLEARLSAAHGLPVSRSDQYDIAPPARRVRTHADPHTPGRRRDISPPGRRRDAHAAGMIHAPARREDGSLESSPRPGPPVRREHGHAARQDPLGGHAWHGPEATSTSASVGELGLLLKMMRGGHVSVDEMLKASDSSSLPRAGVLPASSWQPSVGEEELLAAANEAPEGQRREQLNGNETAQTREDQAR